MIWKFLKQNVDSQRVWIGYIIELAKEVYMLFQRIIIIITIITTIIVI